MTEQKPDWLEFYVENAKIPTEGLTFEEILEAIYKLDPQFLQELEQLWIQEVENKK